MQSQTMWSCLTVVPMASVLRLTDNCSPGLSAVGCTASSQWDWLGWRLAHSTRPMRLIWGDWTTVLSRFGDLQLLAILVRLTYSLSVLSEMFTCWSHQCGSLSTIHQWQSLFTRLDYWTDLWPLTLATPIWFLNPGSAFFFFILSCAPKMP